MTRLLLVLLLLPILGCENPRLAQLEKENRELAGKLDAVSKSANLDLQEKCAKQASFAFHEMGWDKQALASYTDHYHRKLNKCFIEISNMQTSNKAPSIGVQIQDAFEGKGYAEYFWTNRDGKKYWEVKPFICKVTMPSGEQRVCDSQKEFDELVSVYMEE